MLHRRYTDLLLPNLGFAGLVISAIVLLTLPAFGQLTIDDIHELQRQGAEKGWTFEVSQNSATKYALDQLCGMILDPPGWQKNANWDPCTPKQELPSRFDWREPDGLPPIRDQESCGSCWAFSTVGALECAIKIQDDEVVDLSEQWLVNCNQSGWDCLFGGSYAHDYHLDSAALTDRCGGHGAVLEENFPYTATDGPCNCPHEHHYYIESWTYIGSISSPPTDAQMKQAILDHGPISVSCVTNEPFHAYSGGVFNDDSNPTATHAIVLVGWDDTLGTQGAWILRNSWGPDWGMDGYMYVAYGCAILNYRANYINYRGGASFEADAHFGWAPLDVNFQGHSGFEVDSWSWDFGDGQTGDGQTAIHSYADTGTYTVGLTVDIAGDTVVKEIPDCIWVVNDSLVPLSTGGYCNSTVEVAIYARNFDPVSVYQLPILYSGDVELEYDSFSTAGCRTDYFEQQAMISQNSSLKRMTFRLVSSAVGSQPDLEPGGGPILKLYFTIPWQTTYGLSTPIQITSYDSYEPQVGYSFATFTPRSSAGSVTLAVPRGDVDGVPGISVSDLTYLVNFVFTGGYPPYPPGSGDVDCSGGVEISDVTYLVAYLFMGGPEPGFCY